MAVQKLFEPLQMGDFELKNRIVLAPMTRGRAGVERIPNELKDIRITNTISNYLVTV